MARQSPRSLDPRVETLFSEPPERFVAARDALVRELSGKDAALAARVKALRRPTRRVWILNLLARERPTEVEALLEAGERLRAAHGAALQGRRDAGLRSADEEVSRRLDTLVAAAGALLSTSGRPPQHADRVAIRADLRAAAAAGGSVAEQLRSGTLDHAPRWDGDTSLASALGASVAPARHGAGTARTSAREEAARRRAERAAGDRARREDARRRTTARAEADRERQRARRALAKAQAEAVRNEAALREVESRAAALRVRALAARRARDAASEVLRRAEASVAALDRGKSP